MSDSTTQSHHFTSNEWVNLLRPHTAFPTPEVKKAVDAAVNGLWESLYAFCVYQAAREGQDEKVAHNAADSAYLRIRSAIDNNRYIGNVSFLHWCYLVTASCLRTTQLAAGTELQGVELGADHVYQESPTVPPIKPPGEPQTDKPGGPKRALEGLTRYTDISCPQKVWVGTTRFSVVVRLTVERTSHSVADVELQSLEEELPVHVHIEAPLFDVLNESNQKITILRDADSAPVVFDLHPRQTGNTDITLDFYQKGDPVGTATFTVEVTADQGPEQTAPRVAAPIKVEADLTPPDMVLHIAWTRATSTLQFTLIQDGGASWNDGFQPVVINSDLAVKAAALYRQITSLVGANDPTVAVALHQEQQIPYSDVERRIKSLGQNLWRDLIPEELKALYGREREAWRNRTLLVYSDEPYFPWELIWPYEGGAWEDEGPWCQTMRLTRWLRKDDRGNGNAKASGYLPIATMAVLAPEYSLLQNLASAQAEKEVLLKMMSERGLRDLSPTDTTWQAVLDLLESGGYDWLHVASHGNFFPEAPDADSAIWLQEDTALTPQHITGMRIEGHMRTHRPKYFLNACEVGRGGWALTRIGGWANRLVSCGCGVFVGPLWAVEDGSALTFAKTFYSSLFAGETLATATQLARAAARQEGDPTWLAYSVYGHPNAQLLWIST